MERQTDFLIIGSGIAGLSLAIKLSTLGSVVIATKKKKRVKHQLCSRWYSGGDG